MLDAFALLLFQKNYSGIILKPYEESQVIPQCLIQYLADCNIETSAYGMYEMRQSPTDWIVGQQKKANAVLCVCNREFFEDWSSPSLDHNPKVVNILFHTVSTGFAEEPAR